MSEGELRMRLFKSIRYIDNEHLYGFPETIFMLEVKSIIDEAKKDICSEITRIEQAIEEEQGELNGMDYHEFYHRIKPKIKKWFGYSK